jgi:hypothetical protein
MPLILEGLVTTRSADGKFHLTPMGPIVDREITQLTLRPFRTSQTYQNLCAVPEGVFHVTDDVELLACALTGQLDAALEMQPAKQVNGVAVKDVCRRFEFRVRSRDDSAERATLVCEIIHREEVRPFFGWNRAKHAVVEAAILASRVGILPADEIKHEMQRLKIMVDKTAGDQESRAFALLQNYIQLQLDAAREPEDWNE